MKTPRSAPRRSALHAAGRVGGWGAQIVVEAPSRDNPNVVHLTHGSRPSSRPLSDEALLGSAAASDSYDQP